MNKLSKALTYLGLPLALIDIFHLTAPIGIPVVCSLSFLTLFFQGPLSGTSELKHSLNEPPILIGNDFDGSHSCEAAFFSPLFYDITAAADKLNKLPRSTRCDHIVPTNKPGSHDCTVLATAGSASVAVCGVQGLGVYCYQAAWAAEAIARNCGWNGAGQGSVIFNGAPGISIVVSHHGNESGGKVANPGIP